MESGLGDLPQFLPVVRKLTLRVHLARKGVVHRPLSPGGVTAGPVVEGGGSFSAALV